MNPAQQEEQRLQERFETADAEIEKVLKKILKKDIFFLTDDDKRFLQARRAMLDDYQQQKYSGVLSEKLPRPDGQPNPEEERQIEQLTRKELEAMAVSIGIETPEDKKLYRTNADLQDAIKAKQAEQE